MILPKLAALEEIEKAEGCRYPRSFIEFIETDAIYEAVITRLYPGGTFIQNPAECRQCREQLPTHLLPFFRAPLSTEAMEDFYCFDLQSPGPDYRVVVWCDHAVVREWGHFTDWLNWSKQKARDVNG